MTASPAPGLTYMLRSLETIFFCGIFMVTGPALILLNKYIMQKLDFPYPMFLSGMGVLVSGFFAQILVGCGYVNIEKPEAVTGSLYWKRVLPVGVAYAGTLALGNYTYLFLDVGFIQMLKSFTPVVVMIGLYFSGIEIPSRAIVISIVIISIGTALTCSFTPNASSFGILIMFMSEVAEATRLIFTQFFLKDLKFGVVESQYVLAPASAGCLFAASLFCEVPTMYSNGGFLVLMNHPWSFLAASGMGLIVNFLSYFVIQVTSSLTLKVLGTFRNILVIFIGVGFYGEQVTVSEGLGYILALVGFVGYNAAQMKLIGADSSALRCSSTSNTSSLTSDENKLASSSKDSDIDCEVGNNGDDGVDDSRPLLETEMTNRNGGVGGYSSMR